MTCGSAFRNKGVQAVLDAVIEYLPSPADKPPVVGILENNQPGQRLASDDEPFAALAFKIAADPIAGNLTFFRVYSGVLNSGDTVFNPVKARRERIGRLLQMHANEREEISEVRAGDIAAAVGLEDVTTGDTLTDERHVITLEKMEFPEPVISVALEPRTEGDQEQAGPGAAEARRGRSHRSASAADAESGQAIISGMGELHLEIIVDRLRREFDVDANVGRPQVAYRETIRSAVEQEGRFVRQSGGRGQYGHVVLRLEPLPTGAGSSFENAWPMAAHSCGITCPPSTRASVSRWAAACGAGFPLVDVKVTLVDGSYHDVGLQRGCLQDRQCDGLQGRLRQGRIRPARAHHEGRGGDARAVHGGHQWRPEPPSWNRPRRR